jgi:glycosyltransferase
MRITVITVAYNAAATLGDTLRSAARQTHVDLEHIVVDGGSTDGTPGVVQAHGGHLAHYVSERDRGIYDAMNKGIAMATGDYVGFLNADDAFASDAAVSRIADACGDRPDAVYGDLEYVHQDDPTRVVRRWRSGRFAPARLRFGWMPPHPTFYASRTLLDRVGGFDIALKVAADYDLMMRCLTQPGVRLGYVPDVLVRMRLGGISNGSLRSIARKSLEDLQVIRRNGLGGWFTLASKNLRKLEQLTLLRRTRAPH